MMYELIFAPEFAEDLERTYEYISRTLESPSAAASLMREIDNTVTSLKSFPERNPLCREPLDALGYRKLVVKNYIMIYYVNKHDRKVNLLRCFYGKRDYIRYFSN